MVRVLARYLTVGASLMTSRNGFARCDGLHQRRLVQGRRITPGPVCRKVARFWFRV